MHMPLNSRRYHIEEPLNQMLDARLTFFSFFMSSELMQSEPWTCKECKECAPYPECSEIQ
jgi:hypothetical protein